MFPCPGRALCPAASPCARLSRAPSTTGGSDFHRSLCLPQGDPFGRHTRSTCDQDYGGSPRSLDASISARAVLSDPAGVSGILAHDGCLLLPSTFTTVSAPG